MKGEKLLFVLSSHSSFHSADVFSDFFLVLIADYVLYFDLFLDFISLFYWSYTFRWRDGFFYWICTIFLFIDSTCLFCHLLKFLYIFHRLYLFYQLFWNLFYDLFRRLSWLKNLLFFIYLIRALRRHFILRVLRLKDLLHVLGRWILRILWVILCIWSILLFISLLFLDCFCTLYFLNVFSSTLFLNIDTIFTLDFVFTFILLFNIVINLVILFAELRLIL